MFPLWDDVIAPVIDAAGARRIVEIGALRGETTARMLKRLGSECELHVIDPVPQFDPSEHEAIATGEAAGVASGTVLETLERGYRVDSQVIRPARVVVSG